MKKYSFKLTEANFEAPSEIKYNLLEHKMLNESIADIEIVVLSENIETVGEKVDKLVAEIIAAQFPDYPNIKFYRFGLKITKIEEIS